jgi:predicted transcriptional regulator
MVNIKRDRTQIWHAMLNTALESRELGVTKTRLVYQANLNFRTVNPHLELLLKNEYLKQYDSKYKITPKGRKFIEIIEQVPGVVQLVTA